MKILRGLQLASVVALVSMTAQSQHAFLDQLLLDKLSETSPNELIPVALVLKEKADLLGLKAEMNERKTPARDRAPMVEIALKEVANSTQPAIVNFIENSNLDYEDITLFWISNSIALRAEAELIELLSLREDISDMYLNRNAFGYVDKPSVEDGGAKSVGGIEPGLEAIGAPEMWAMGYTGHGRIGMTYDTGVWDDHPSHNRRFLANRMPVLSTWFGYDSPVPVDKSSSHGTHVTGTILGLDTATADTIGVAPRAYYIATDPVVSNLAFVKPLTDFMFGYEWALDPDGDPETTHDIPDVINNSWGFGPDLDEAPCPDFVIPVFTALEVAGIANVFSAGNEGPGDMTMSVPHNTNIGLVNSFTVGATSSGGSFPIANFSSRGPSICGGEGSLLIKPEVSAPGVSVRSSIENGEYDLFSGTSMAAPHVSGAVLLLKEAFPDVTGEEILLALYNTAIDLGAPGEDNTYGMGFINVKSAFDLLAETHVPTPPSVLIDDIELVRIVFPSDDLICSSANQTFTPTVQVQNNGITAIEGFTIIAAVGDGIPTSEDFDIILQPGQSQEISLSEVAVEGDGLLELHIQIAEQENEYDVLNNHGVYRFSKLREYDWAIEGPFTDDFSEGIDESIWTVYNPDYSITWDTVLAIQSDGSIGYAAYMNHPDYLNSTSELDHLISPVISNHPQNLEALNFDYFYRKRSNIDFTKDTLIVFINRSCDDTYMSEEIFRLGGDELWTNDDSESNAFPESSNDWLTVSRTLDLQVDEPFFFSFVTVNRRGNNLLVDNISLGSPLSVQDEKNKLRFELFPNPNTGDFRVNWDGDLAAKILVTDISGRLVHQELNTAPNAKLNLQNLSSGVYIVQLLVGEYTASSKLIID
ncbi:MAG: S8 family peptidase [Flavobacteriales bacterium]|nr:S8 family peptidase [Flavobacteriales bacterium]